jgi:patatin-like phospholipase/acyl hydrolase
MFRYAEHSEFSCTLILFDDDGYSWVPIVKQPKFRDILVRDVCRATTAAPTFFSPVDFTVSKYVEQQVPEEEPAEKEGTHKKPYAYTDAKADEEADADPDEGDDTQATFNMIDGGIAANNPTYVGVTQALRHCGNGAGVADQKSSKQKSSKPLLVLSLGTGRHQKGYTAEDARRWGVINWLRYKGDTPLINSLQNASAAIVDYDLSLMFGQWPSARYLRIQTDLPQEMSKLDNVEPGNLDSLENLARKLLRKRVSNVNLQTGKLDNISNTRNYQALSR